MKNLPIQITESPEAGKMPELPIVFGSQNLEALYQQVEQEVSAEVPDVDSVDGRARIKSLAAKISKSKTAIDTPIRDHLRALKSIPKELEKNARESKERFDSLRDSVLAPLNAAQASQDSIIERLNEIMTLCNAFDCSSVTALSMRSEVEAVNLDLFWPELKKKAKAAHEGALQMASDAFTRLEREEAQKAELEDLRQKQAAAEQAERDRKIAEAAAEQARQQAAQQAAQEREAIERRAIEAKQREEHQRMEAEQAKRNAELAEQRRVEQEEQSRLAAIEAQKQAEINAKLAAEKAEIAERQRIEAEQAETVRLAKAREENKEHRIKINRAALVALIGEGLSEDDGKKVITAIAKGLIPNIKIMY